MPPIHQKLLYTLATFAAIALTPFPAEAVTLNVLGTDAIFLAGRSDVTIPDLGSSNPTFPLLRHGYVSPDFLKETFPQSIGANPGDIFSFNATGCVHYFNGIGCTPATPGYGPNGNSGGISNLSPLAGISGYLGPQGALVGLFLGSNNPVSGVAPATLDFTASGIGTSFSTLSPTIGQLFFIGDGSGKSFIAPSGATRLFVGIPDGFSFVNVPGAYDDNDGSYTVEANAVPEPTTIAGIALAGGLFGAIRKRRMKQQ